MNIFKKTVVGILFMGLFVGVNAFGQDSSARRQGGRRQGPPPEAYTACEGKSAGDAAEFTSRRGDTVTGTCEEQGDQLVLRPDRRREDAGADSDSVSGNEQSSQRKGGRRQGPPPEAYTACEGKSAGDAAEFTSRRGDTVTGTCEEQGDQLVLRPDRPREDSGEQAYSDN